MTCRHTKRFTNIFKKRTHCLDCGKIVEPKFTIYEEKKNLRNLPNSMGNGVGG